MIEDTVDQWLRIAPVCPGQWYCKRANRGSLCLIEGDAIAKGMNFRLGRFPGTNIYHDI